MHNLKMANISGRNM